MLRGSRVIVIGGLKRSGSTWQYNLVRVILTELGRSVAVHGGLRNLGQYQGSHDDLLIKSHFHSERAERIADLVFTSFRPVDQVRASLERFGGRPVSMEELDRLCTHFELWDRVASYRMEYEMMLTDPVQVVRDTLSVLSANTLDPSDILATMRSLVPPDGMHQDPVTLYFGNHITTSENRP